MRNKRLYVLVNDSAGPLIPAQDKLALDAWRAQEREDKAEPPRVSSLLKLRLLSALAHVAARLHDEYARRGRVARVTVLTILVAGALLTTVLTIWSNQSAPVPDEWASRSSAGHRSGQV